MESVDERRGARIRKGWAYVLNNLKANAFSFNIYDVFKEIAT